MKRQSVRRLILLISLLLFPLVINFLSPYLIISGAFEGALVGSGIVFISLFLFSLFTGRLFCGWLCPMGGLNDILSDVNNKRVVSRAAKRIKYLIWAIWIAGIVGGFIFAGGIHRVDPLYLTETGVSVDEPAKYITYYMVLLLFAVISILVGRRASCHTICWIAPFMILGRKCGRLLHLPTLHIDASNENCIRCKRCSDVCPMSIDVMNLPKGYIANNDCILCGRCVDGCPKGCQRYQWTDKPDTSAQSSSRISA